MTALIDSVILQRLLSRYTKALYRRSKKLFDSAVRYLYARAEHRARGSGFARHVKRHADARRRRRETIFETLCPGPRIKIRLTP
jgi:hypothetical protein